jgi:hypothetical protein
MWPSLLAAPLLTATSFVPSDDDATDVQYCWGAVVWVQVAPESEDA